MSLAAWMPSSLRFFSICLLRASAARSSALIAQPMAQAAVRAPGRDPAVGGAGQHTPLDSPESTGDDSTLKPGRRLSAAL